MKPTNKLRFVRRQIPDPTFGKEVSVYKHILQQWWESESSGEWRDVPVEDEE